MNRDDRLPVVAVDVVYFVGMKDDPGGQSGISHFFEHLMFHGSRHVGEDMLWKYLEQAGARSIGGRTELERTIYSETIPSGQVELALWLESDRMAFMLEKVSQASLETQRRVIENEDREKLENTPYGNVQNLIDERLFPAGHPYHRTTAPARDLARITLADLRRFAEKYYRPNNATLFVSGDFQTEDLKRQIAKYFGPIVPGAPVDDRFPPEPPALASDASIDVVAAVPATRVYLTWLTPRFGEEGDADLDIVAEMMQRDLNWHLKRELQLATSVWAHQRSQRLAGTFEIVIAARPGIDAVDIVHAVNEAVESLRTKERDAPFIRAMTFALMLRLTSTYEHPTSRVGHMASDSFLTGDPAFLQKDIARYEAITPASIQGAVQKFLRLDARLVTVVTPQRGVPAAGRVASSR